MREEAQKRGAPAVKDWRAAYEAGTNPFEVGDIVVESWGYDQINKDFFEVVAVTKASVRIKPLRQRFVEQRGPAGDKVVPAPGQYREQSTRYGKKDDRGVLKRVKWSDWRPDQPEPYLNMTSYSSAHPWDGRPEYQTDPVFGH